MQESEDPTTPEFWFGYLMAKFNEPVPENKRVTNAESYTPTNRRERLELLWDYVTGNPPLPFISDKYIAIFQKIMRKARTNYPLLVIEAMTDRSKMSSVTTDVDSDFDGDDFARRVHDASGFTALHSDLQTYLFTFGEAYAQVVPPAEGLSVEDTPPLISAEDPRFCIGSPDPLRPNRLRAWVKVWTDDIMKQQVATMYWQNTRFTIRREPEQYSDSFNIEEWEYSTLPGENNLTMEYLTDFGGVPVVQFQNKFGLGEFEPHIDVIDRIIDAILQRIVIQWYQSFRQRAIKGDIDAGVDFSDTDLTDDIVRDMRDGGDTLKNLFEADPGSLWMVPEGVDFWESSITDLSPMQKTILDDVKTFSAVTRTPLHMLTPDSANQTAEGAGLMREFFLDKIKDRQARQTPGWILLHQIAFAMAGEENRATNVRLQWASPDRTSLQVKGDFIIKTKGVLSRKRQLINILEMTPDEAKLNESELTQELLLAQTFSGNDVAAQPADEPTTTTDEPAAPATPPADTTADAAA